MKSRRNFLKAAGGAAGMAMFSKSAFSSAVTGPDHRPYWLPEESDRHLRTFMQWPVSRTVYPDSLFLEMVQSTIADIANAIVQFEPVVMLMDRQFENTARKKLSKSVEIWDIPTEDLWCRDAGPVFVRNKSGELAITSFNFNGWGQKQIHDNDGQIAERVAERLGMKVFNNGLVGEAGGVEADGAGILLAHESSWVIKNRNSGTRKEIERLLTETLGAKTVIWAPGIKDEDITDYHIDSLARFVSPGNILIQLPEKVISGDSWSAAAYETYEILKNATDLAGKKFNISIIPEPETPRITSPDFVAAYVNYYVCNGAVISAQFGDEETDEAARTVLASAYPNREIIALKADSLGEVGGGIHCATQQQPAT